MWTSDNDFIFSTYRGTPRTREKVLLNVLKPVKKKLGLSVLNFQVLRRTMATLSQHSGSIKDIQSHLRHRSPDVTATEYVQEIPDSARNMVATVYNAVLEPDSKEDHQE
jgi:integrase